MATFVPLVVEFVEIKATVGAEAVDDAAKSLRLRRSDAQKRDIWFCEYRRGPTGTGGLPLLNEGVIVRLRRRRGDDDDTTVKIRRNVVSLPSRWARLAKDEEHAFRVEGDWTKGRRVVSASLVESCGGGVALVVKQGRGPRSLLSSEQMELLHRATSLPIDADVLKPLGPVAARKWEWEDRDFPRPLAAEEWRADTLRFLELSLRVTLDQAESAQVQLEDYLGKRGLAVAGGQETKTRLVLEHFAAS